MTRSQIAARVFAAILAAAAFLFVADYVYRRIRMLHATPNEPFESRTRTRIFAIAQKGGKTDYQIDQLQPVETLTCVHSLFPHYGNPPCWYLKPRLNRPIPIS